MWDVGVGGLMAIWNSGFVSPGLTLFNYQDDARSNKLKILQEVYEGIQQSSIFIVACFISIVLNCIVLLLISDISMKLKWNMLLTN